MSTFAYGKVLTPNIALKSTFKACLTHNRYSRFVTFDIIFIPCQKVKFFWKCFLCNLFKNRSQFLTEYSKSLCFSTIYCAFSATAWNIFCEIFKKTINYYKIITKSVIVLLSVCPYFMIIFGKYAWIFHYFHILLYIWYF